MYANCRRFGLPTFFFTLAPDYRDPLTIRLGISRPIYSGFPYEDGGYQNALHNWDIAGRPGNMIFQTDFRISPITTTSNIQDIGRKNATAQSIVYMSMLKAVFEGLLGISMDEHVKKQYHCHPVKIVFLVGHEPPVCQLNAKGGVLCMVIV